ncbi:glucosamine--fructose-6-phosphate aminotransferase [Mesorhizobium sp. 131-3-5]|uniref:SIS domain-containing protein n=1 Tax=Mesorhizobium sp. 131-3-5 TaxID=2744520 RepID=UPI00192876EC|nr:SIS domain-containing protein [Mesorhizobium sp. 131-3-5]BCH08400.1 glucosamine--fructose-6-phosphate aminotransferase [Mesorhizobium sp. 131-3-5]
MTVAKNFLADIHEQPAAIRRALAGVTGEKAAQIEALSSAVANGRIRHIILTGMGGSLFSAYGSWQRLARFMPVPVSLWDTSELIQQAPELLRSDTLVIAISQSGESVELKKLSEGPIRPFFLISITNGPTNSLSEWADCAVATDAGKEDAVSTKTYVAGLVALYVVERLFLGRSEHTVVDVEAVAEAAAASLGKFESRSHEIFEFLGHDKPLTFIGRGASYSSAAMGALMTAEAAKLDCTALTGGQFRHGPLELVREGFRAVLFLGSGPERELNELTALDIARFGGRCVVVCSSPPDELRRPEIEILELPYATEALLPALEIIPLQFMMVPLAVARGFPPAVFLNGTKVTVIE